MSNPLRKGRSGLPSSTGSYISLNDGESINIAFIGDTDDFISFDQWQLWIDGGNSPMLCNLQAKWDPCTICQREKDKPKYRAMSLVLVENVDGELEEKVFAFGSSMFKMLIDIEDAVGGLHGRVVRIKRTGTGLKTRYSATFTGEIEDAVPEVDETEKSLIEYAGPLDPYDQIEILKEAGLWTPKHQREFDKLYDGGIEDEDEDDEEVVEKKPARKKRTSSKSTPKTRRKKKAQKEPEDVDDADDDADDDDDDEGFE